VTRALKTKNTPAPDDGKQYATPHEMAHSAVIQNAAALEPWAAMFGNVDMNGLSHALMNATARVTKDGDMREPEAMLYGQAVALQTIFTSLSRRAALNAGEYINATETYLRLALKAQAQCRATLETLHEMKNPRPVAFVQQANIAHGPQQVNNRPARAGETETAPKEQSRTDHELLQDARASQTTVGAHSRLEAVGTINRTTDTRREGEGITKCLEGRVPRDAQRLGPRPSPTKGGAGRQ
jgi:hypothetical protein